MRPIRLSSHPAYVTDQRLAAPREGSLVTVSIRRQVKVGRERDYEAGLSAVLAEAVTLPGTSGATVLALGGSPASYQILLHFDDEAGRRAWSGSPVRRRWLDRMDELTNGIPEIEVLDAQHAWLVQRHRSRTLVAPPRHKVALLTWAGIYPVITVLLALLGPRIAPWPLVARTFVLTACAIPLMTWVVMPTVTRLARPWLQPHSDPPSPT